MMFSDLEVGRKFTFVNYVSEDSEKNTIYRKIVAVVFDDKDKDLRYTAYLALNTETFNCYELRNNETTEVKEVK